MHDGGCEGGKGLVKGQWLQLLQMTISYSDDMHRPIS